MSGRIYSFARSGPLRLAPPVPGGTMCGLYPEAWRGGQLVPHSGIDFCAPRGTPIVMPIPGVVTRRTVTEHGGNNFTVRHDSGFVTYYAHADEILVDVGQAVRRFEVVATVGQTGVTSAGRSIDPHLHFQVQASEEFSSVHYDPEALLEALGIYRAGLVWYWKDGYPPRSTTGLKSVLAAVAGAGLVVGLAVLGAPKETYR